MKSHLSEDSDDENCEDLIRLIDNDINAIYFGSRPYVHGTRDTESRWTLEPIGNNTFCQPTQNPTLGRPDDDISTLQGGTTSECDISPLSVKLVDCGKFPWYFRKYTQQIMQKIKSNDCDHETDVESVADDTDDCFIVEANEIIKNDQNYIKTVESTESPPKLNKSEIIKRLRDDRELQIALSKKNIHKVDLKRNQGLVGMKITQKMGTNTTPHIKTDRKNVVEEAHAKQKCVMDVEKYISAAAKTLSSLSTQVIPITNDRKSNATQFNNENDFEEKPTLKSSSSQNLTVQFEISKISEKLIDNLIAKKISDQSSQDKIVSKVPNKSLYNNPENKLTISNDKNISSKVTTTEKIANSPTKVISHVKDVKKTNKYKNDQLKIRNCDNHRSLIGLLVTNKSKEDIKEIKCTKQKKRAPTQSMADKHDRKPRKKVEKQKHGPKSPILHCSAVPKKLKNKMHPQCNKADTNSNLPKEPSKVKKMVDRISNNNSCSLIYEATRPKHVIPETAPVTKPDVTSQQALQKDPVIMQDKTISQVGKIHANSLIVSDKLPTHCNEVNKTGFKNKNFQNIPIVPSSQNKTYEQNVFHDFKNNNFQNHPIIPSSQNKTYEQNVLHETPQDNHCNEVNKTGFKNKNFQNTPILPSSQNKTYEQNVFHDFKNNNFQNAPIIPSNQNKTYEQNVFHETPQDNVNKHTKNTVPVTNPTLKSPSKNNKLVVSDSNVSTTAAIMPTTGTKPVLSNQYTNFPSYHGSRIPVHNSIPSRMNSNNHISKNNVSNNNINVPIQNRYASAIILKSHNHKKFPYQNIHEPPLQTMAPYPQRPMTIPSQNRYKDPQPPCPIYYPPAPSGRLQSYFPCPPNSVSSQFNPPHGHIGQPQSNPMQNFYRECWLPQNLAPPPPPPPPPPCDPPINIPQRNDQDINKSKNSSESVMQISQNVSHQNSISTPQTKNSSIIGINNDGLVKKINIVAMHAKNNVDNKQGVIKVEQITNSQNMIPLEDGEVVATKTEMLKELDKLSFVDEILDFKGTYPAKIIGEDKKESTIEVAIMSKKPGRFETLKLTMDKKDIPVQKKPANGYSPPILPIPSFQKVLNQAPSNSQTQNTISKMPPQPGDTRSIKRIETTPMRKRDFVKCCKRKLINAFERKEYAKKISIDEYKKRILKTDSKPEHNKKKIKEKYNNSGKLPNIEFKFRKNVDYSTETDLGYDSDSTVVL